MRIPLFVLCCSISTLTLAQPKVNTNESLLEECTAATKKLSVGQMNEHLDARSCLGYILGYADGISAGAANSKAVCIPRSVTTGQMARVVVKHLQDHPNTLHEPRNWGIQAAFMKAYPCGR
jgi:hypothetical protein